MFFLQYEYLKQVKILTKINPWKIIFFVGSLNKYLCLFLLLNLLKDLALNNRHAMSHLMLQNALIILFSFKKLTIFDKSASFILKLVIYISKL